MLTKLQIILIVVMGFLFLSALGNFFDLKKYGIHFFPLGIMFRTEFFNRILEKLGEKGKRVWAVMYNVGKVLATIITIGFLAYFSTVLFFDIHPDPLKLISIVLLAGILSAVILTFMTIIIIFFVFKRGYDPDNITGPALATFGDIVTMFCILGSAFLIEVIV